MNAIVNEAEAAPAEQGEDADFGALEDAVY
jgi:hypothetical protein